MNVAMYVGAFAGLCVLLVLCFFAMIAWRMSKPSMPQSPAESSVLQLRASLEALELRLAEQGAALQRLIARERTAGARAAKQIELPPETPDQWREKMNRKLAMRNLGGNLE